MLVNKPVNSISSVEFVSYTGKYPNLCNGILTLKIDGVKYTFGENYKRPKPNFEGFWHSGGYVERNYSGVVHNEWKIDVEGIPEQFRKYATEIDEVFNKNVAWGCCGGCI